MTERPNVAAIEARAERDGDIVPDASLDFLITQLAEGTPLDIAMNKISLIAALKGLRHARTGIRALLAKVAELEKENKLLRRSDAGASKQIRALEAERDQVAALREAVTDLIAAQKRHDDAVSTDMLAVRNGDEIGDAAADIARTVMARISASRALMDVQDRALALTTDPSRGADVPDGGAETR